jgi:Protein of unknown function (DUF3467)
MTEETKLKQEYTPIENISSVYANSARLNISLWDFKFSFGEVEEITPDVMRVSEKVRVLMSPQHAKVFLQVFQQNLKRYEDKFGEIKVPVGIVEEAEKES